MLNKIFGDSPQVKLIDFLVAQPWAEFSKTEMADGAEIARPTVYKLLDKLLNEDLIIESRKVGNIQLYQTNRKSIIIKQISSLQGILADMEVEKQKKMVVNTEATVSDLELDNLLGLDKEDTSLENAERGNLSRKADY